MLYRDRDRDGRGGSLHRRSGSDDDMAERTWRPLVRFVYNNPIYTVGGN